MKNPMCKTNLTLRHRGLRLITMCHINSLLKIEAERLVTDERGQVIE